MKTYGYDRIKLSDHYTVGELCSLAQGLRDDPINLDHSDSVQIYNAKTRRRLDNISWAIRNISA